MSENKLQIRAKILSAIANLQNNTTDMSFVGNTIDDLNTIQDKETVLDILHKEFLKENTELKDYTISFLLSELIDKEMSEKVFFETLANPKINDAIKTKAVSFLREIGKHVKYEDYVTYFENPDDIIDADTTRLLENAKINPESQIDFLDFLAALPQKEKDMLLTSLIEDYDGDNLTNILIPVILSNPYSELSQSAIKAIGESKSNLAFYPLNWVLENIEDLKIKSNAQKSLSLLKLSGVKTDISKEYYKKLLENSPIYKCFTNYPDGHGNVGIIFSRKTSLDFIQMFALVLNDMDGIVDCFGFNEISDTEFERIVTKFYQNNKVVETTPEFCKYLIENAEKISRLKYESVSYEYIAWKSIIKDIEDCSISLKENLSKIELSEFLLKQTNEQGYFDKWFFEANDNEAFSNVIDEVINNKITDINKIEELLEYNKSNIFDVTWQSYINDRLTLCAYLAKTEGDEVFSQTLYSLVDESKTKDEFLSFYLQKSFYQYFLAQRDKYDSLKNTTSIFLRKSNKDLNEIDIKYIGTVIDTIEKNWI